jgi:VWFA-related protein
VVRVETDLTNILFTAIDKNKRFITEMRKEDVRILEDGVPQEIFTFERQTDRPLSLALLIDTSISEERTLPAEKRAAAAFVDSVVRADKDEVAVISFTGESTLEQGLTGSTQRIRRALERVEFVPPAGYIGGGTVSGTPPISGTNQSLAGSTAIWDSVWVTSEDVLSQTSDKTRRAIILLTDGQDTSSQKKMAEAVDRAVKNDVVVYCIGIGDAEYGGINEGSLKKVAERTGGRAFFPDDESELRAAFTQIQLELRSQFLVAYSPTNKNRDGSFRKVQIEILNPDLRKQSLRLNYRQGYFARTATASTKD